jgi:hypothetical protein
MGESALHYAVRSDNLVAISLLLAQFADLNIVSDEGFTPRALAIHLKKIKAAELLESVERKEGKTTHLPSSLWLNIFGCILNYLSLC